MTPTGVTPGVTGVTTAVHCAVNVIAPAHVMVCPLTAFGTDAANTHPDADTT